MAYVEFLSLFIVLSALLENVFNCEPHDWQNIGVSPFAIKYPCAGLVQQILTDLVFSFAVLLLLLYMTHLDVLNNGR